jgi:hypothetical protein
MRSLALLLLLATPALAHGQDWTFDWEYSYHLDEGHLCFGSADLWPYDIDVPWGQVAYGELRFDIVAWAKFESNKPVPCTATCGDQVVMANAMPGGECGSVPGCFDHYLDIRATFTVHNPTSFEDFNVYVYSDQCDQACAGFECDDSGLVFAHLDLYAHPTAIAGASWSTIRALY